MAERPDLLSAYIRAAAEDSAAITMRAAETREREKDERAARERKSEQDARERLQPLEVRLAKLLATIPPTVQAEGLSLPALQQLLRGRGRAHPPPGHIGFALRTLGWRRERRWRNEAEGFRALWLPPEPK